MKRTRMKRFSHENGNVDTGFDRNKGILERKRRRLSSRRGRKANKESVESVVAKYDHFAQEDSSTLQSFSQFPLSSATLKGLEENNFKRPTEIQRDSLQYSLTGVDVVGAAKTGSGKTLALLIPVDGLGALVISPTRELAYQTFHVLNKIGAHHNFSAALLIGGTDVEFEKNRLATVNIVVCTPGRLLQHMDENVSFSCEQLQILIIDEADRILDLGFQQQMNAIVENLPSTRQTLLFSATQTKNVNDLARLALKDPVYVSVHENAPQATPEQLQQSYLICADEEKINMLWSYLVNHRKKKTLIFARFLTEALCHLRPGTSLMGLWGTMKQSRRLDVFHKFDRKTGAAAMIATDVASRGLDFARVDCVLQLDCPSTVDDYIHRVGRTARMDAKGEGILVLTPSQEEAMVACLTAKNVPISKIRVDQRQLLDIRKKLQSTIAQFPSLKEFAQRSFVAYIRSIYLMANKDVFDVHSIDCKALAESYGLVVVPRVRFLARAAAKGNLNKGSTAPKGQKEKSANELLEMVLASAKNANANAHLRMIEGNGECDYKVNDPTNEVDFEVSEEIIGHESGSHLVVADVGDGDDEGESDDLLKVVHKDVFHVLGNQNEERTPSSERQPKKREKVLLRSTLAKKILKKGIKPNVKKVFDEDGHEIAMPQPTKSTDESNERFDLEEAKREMVEADKVDKAAYRAKMSRLRKERKAKLKKKVEGRKKARDESGGAVLDLGEDGSESEHDDLSWLPDPDKPKKYDAFWNEIKSSSEDEEEGDERRITKKKKGHTNKRKKEQDGVLYNEAKALALLESTTT
uniref:ATP-dependent RNA helicase n=1 Tax=Ascaris lumbricoides TaxID=6252 RepID=A0A9J2PUJ4_ASCLU